jgi:HEAT repeat protein
LPEAELYRRSAGRSPYEMTKDADRFPVERILDAAELVGRGPEKLEQLKRALKDPESGVRYWAAVGLTVLGKDAAPAAEALLAAIEDPCPNVRFAAAEALCNLNGDEKAVPVLGAGLEHEDRWVRLAAAMSLVAVGQDAWRAVPAMREAVEDKTKHQASLYIRWALKHALSRLQP